MSRVTCHQSTSADGYAAGPNQTEERPFGDDGGAWRLIGMHLSPISTPPAVSQQER